MAIKLKGSAFFESVRERPDGSIAATRRRTAITHGSVETMTLLLTFGGSAGRYDVRILGTDPSGAMHGGQPVLLMLDGRRDGSISHPFACPIAGQYTFRILTLGHESRSEPIELGHVAFEVRPQ